MTRHPLDHGGISVEDERLWDSTQRGKATNKGGQEGGKRLLVGEEASVGGRMREVTTSPKALRSTSSVTVTLRGSSHESSWPISPGR